jgi:Carboxypeptidase regulatory-like domain/TonB dependent receptor/TonB-dependent Receptor Plug Domain
MKHSWHRLLLSAILLLVSVTAFGQATTSELTGTVTTNGKALPGVTVTITSPALLGTRTTVTGASGDYDLPSLPPGRYSVRFDLEGMQSMTKPSELRLAETSRVDADLKVSAVAESITVTASAPSVLETPAVSTNLDAKLVEQLPVGRRIQDRITLAPGVQTSGTNGQLVINGAQSFDNLYLVNGVTVNENVRGQPQNAVIEDAIQETTLLTGGVSAEFGRFTGGVVSTITKSGGNDFSGSLRDNLTNDKWISKTPIESANHLNKLNSIYEGTLGGRVIRDRLWFFGAARKQNSSLSDQTVAPKGVTPIQFITATDEKRYEAKLTGNITSKHTLVGSYLKVDNVQSGTRFGNTVDLASLRDVGNPIKLWAAHYNGIITNNFLIEGLYSQKDYSIVGGGASSRDLINGTLLRDRATGWRGWSPTFCGVCPPKERNNKDWAAKGSYFVSTKGMGSHNIIGGYDQFHELRNENNYQSGSDFRFFGDFIFSNNQLFIHADPNNDPGSTNAHSRFEWDPLLGLSQTSDFVTTSYFVNDKWNLTSRWSFNLGLRYDKESGHNQALVKTVDDSRVSPRLGVIYDIAGNGKHRASLTYGRYAAKIDQGPADSTSTGGRYATYLFNYRGPEINPIGTPLDQLVPTAQVLQQVFAWLQANAFVNGQANPNSPLVFSSSVPGLNVRLDNPLKSPYMDEITAGYGLQIGGSGFARADVIHRKWGDFYVIRRDRTTGKTPDGTLDVGQIQNGNSSDFQRNYNGLQLQASYRFLGLFNLGGNYTYARLKGNVEGEEFNNGTVPVGVIQPGGNEVFESPTFPEYTGFAQNRPVGWLQEDIRHRANVYVMVEPPIPFGTLNVSVLERYHSGQPYSAAAAINPTGITNPGYAKPPSAVQYYFSSRGAYRLDSISETDLNVTYSFPITKVSLFIKADLLNAFNQQGIENVESVTSTSGPVIDKTVKVIKSFNPFTETPVAGVNYTLSPTFGQATNKDAYQLPRTYRVAVGLRF